MRSSSTLQMLRPKTVLSLSLLSPSSSARHVIYRHASGLPAAFYRGGTSKAVVFKDIDLPADKETRSAIFRSTIGSPDPHGRQLNGMGGGLSSVSKVVLVGKSSRPDADVEYTFVQVGVKDGAIDYGSNCGNMLAAVGPFAHEQGMTDPAATDPAASEHNTTVRIFNTNTQKVIHSTFPVDPLSPRQPILDGDYALDGVSGTGAPIKLDFVRPGGSRTGKLLPTGMAVDVISSDTVDGYSGEPISATIMDCGNPCVFIHASELDLDPWILPQELEKDGEMLKLLEDVRRAALVLMGLAPTMSKAAKTRSIPKTLEAESADLVVRTISSGDPHRAIPITAALCVAAAAQVNGTLVESLFGGSAGATGGKELVIGHPSGQSRSRPRWSSARTVSGRQ
ncbi:hypothetical protein EHS25_007970 [Saitozyma podzolica]|uniref:Uncharacterized protein n=1 Tax=Saitozyma podzolica TaxID=1890683 RepID=A0A427XL47_9TREE|nr:hypothetical protein EHS25_007970 [Saitozyma podzolica]